MTRTLVGVVLLVLSVVHPAAAQEKPYDFRAPMLTYVDVATKGVWSGWSGNCNTGRAPVAVTLWRVDPDTKAVTLVPTTLTTGARPDASMWLAAVCGRPFDAVVGWSLVPKAPEPDGAFLYAVLVTDVPASWTCGVYPKGYQNAGKTWCDYTANTVQRTVR